MKQPGLKDFRTHRLDEDPRFSLWPWFTNASDLGSSASRLDFFPEIHFAVSCSNFDRLIRTPVSENLHSR